MIAINFMTLDQATKEAAMKTLSTIEDFSCAGFKHGVDRVYFYYDDVEGDWLDAFADEEINICNQLEVADATVGESG